MTRCHLLIVMLAVIPLGQVVVSPAVGQETLERYLDRRARERREAVLRQERWLEERAKQIEAWRQAQATADDPVLELRQAGLPPGNYSIRLPFSVAGRVVVADDAAKTATIALSEQSYGDIIGHGRRIYKQLTELQLELHRLGQAELRTQTQEVFDEAARLASVAAERRPVTDIKAQFADWEKVWTPLAHRLTLRNDLGLYVPKAVSVIEESSNTVQQLLAVGVAPVYDRPVVAVLTGELARATNNLAADLHLTGNRTPQLAAVEILAHRVQRQAADLDATVRANSSFATIVREYEEFVRVWDRLLEEAPLVPEAARHLPAVARRIREIDLQLHPALYVNVPLLTSQQQLANLSTAITRTAAHLADDLEMDAQDSDKDVVYEARLFTRVAQELNRALAQAQPADVQLKAVRDLSGAWQRLSTSLAKLPPARFEHGLAIAANLERDVRRLQELNGQP